MAVYAWTPTHMNGVDLTAAPYESVRFDANRGPAQTRPVEPIEATLPGVGDRNVDVQPHGVEWLIHIWLATTAQTDYDSVKEDWSEQLKLVYLQADDGDGTNYRVALHVTTLTRIEAAHFIAHVRVPDPTWQKNTTTTTEGDFNAMSGDDETQAVVNAGNRDARPLIRYSPQSLRGTDPADRFQIVYRGWAAHRAPQPWDHNGLAVTDSNHNVGAGIDTATLVEDATVHHHINEAGDIDDEVTTWEVDGADGGGLPAVGFAMIDNEQVYYELAGTTISNAIRGIGGTTAAIHLDDAQMDKSSILADGSDIRVFVNGDEVRRWLGGFNTATTRIWIAPSAPPNMRLTLAEDIDNAVTEIAWNEELDKLPVPGILVINREATYYDDVELKNRKTTGHIRGINSGAAAHVAAEWPAHRLDWFPVIAMGRYGLDPAPDLIDYRPCFQLKSSTNAIHRYGDGADDPDTAFWDPDYPNRPDMFQPDYDIDPADENEAVPLLLDESETKAAWKDSAATLGKQQLGRLTLRVPPGIDTPIDSIVYDAQPRRFQRLRMLARDIKGQEVELLDLQDIDEGARNADGLTPDALLYELTMNAIRAGVCGQPATGAFIQLVASAERAYLKFTLDQDTEIDGAIVGLRKTAAGTDLGFRVYSFDDSGGDVPDNGNRDMQFENWSGSGATGTFPSASLTTSFAWYYFYTSGETFFLTAGTHWVKVLGSGGAVGNIEIEASDNPTTKHNRHAANAGNVTYGNGRFVIIHPSAGPVQDDADRLNADDEANFDKLILNLRDSSQYTRQTAISDRGTNPTTDLYHCEGRLTNETTGDYIDVSIWLRVGQKFEIDCEARTVTITDGDWTYPAPGGITPSNLIDWLNFQPGSNTLKWEEAGMVDSDMTIIHRETAA